MVIHTQTDTYGHTHIYCTWLRQAPLVLIREDYHTDTSSLITESDRRTHTHSGGVTQVLASPWAPLWKAQLTLVFLSLLPFPPLSLHSSLFLSLSSMRAPSLLQPNHVIFPSPSPHLSSILPLHFPHSSVALNTC